MAEYRTRLVSGKKAPYDKWAFAVVPEPVHQALGGGKRLPVRGTVAGVAFRGTLQRGEGAYRFAVTRDVRDAAGVAVGEVVDITIEVDTEPRPVEVPEELAAVLAQAGLATSFAALPPSLRRAWAQHVAEAKQPATRVRRAQAAPAAIRDRRYPGQR